MYSNLDWSMKLLSCESHNDEHKACEPIESPLSKTEIIDESVYVCWHDVDDWQEALQITYKKKSNIMLMCVMVDVIWQN